MTVPDPMTPPDCDLRKLDIPMPIDVVALNRDWIAIPNHIYAAHIRLMACAWNSRPTGSIRNSRRLYLTAELSEKIWKRDKDEILRDFILCSDDRYYHKGLCRSAMERFRPDRYKAQRIRAERLGVTQSEWRQLRRMVLRRDNHQCSYCGAINVALHCDHVIPLARGGKTSLDNLVTACGPCNISKSSLLVEEWFQ